MILQAKKPFQGIMKIVEAVNPYIVLISIVGLCLDYTPIKNYVAVPNQVVDIIFVVDFLLRMLAFPPKRYFFKGYGWVDLLAAIPGITAILSIIFASSKGAVSALRIFKTLRIGKFFKIVRILRFLRIFNFLKKMKSDSLFIQDRIMKIGVSIVLVLIFGVMFIDSTNSKNLTDLKADKIILTHKLSDGGEISNKQLANLGFVALNRNNSEYLKLVNGQWKNITANEYDLLHFQEDTYYETSLKKGDNTKTFILFDTKDVVAKHDQIMLIIVLSIIALLIVIIFYIGFVFAKDIRVVQLINDSFDAEDYLLLNAEYDEIVNKTGSEEPQPGEDEIVSLLKIIGKYAQRMDDSMQSELSSLGSSNLMDLNSHEFSLDEGYDGRFDEVDENESIVDDDLLGTDADELNEEISAEDLEEEEIDLDLSADIEEDDIEEDDLDEELTEDLEEELPIEEDIDTQNAPNINTEELAEIISAKFMENLEKKISEIVMDEEKIKDIADKASASMLKKSAKSIIEYIKTNLKPEN